jgi:hypothetical protein
VGCARRQENAPPLYEPGERKDSHAWRVELEFDRVLDGKPFRKKIDAAAMRQSGEVDGNRLTGRYSPWITRARTKLALNGAELSPSDDHVLGARDAAFVAGGKAFMAGNRAPFT